MAEYGRSWCLVPHREWTPGHHELVVDGILEDVAGDSVRRVFDRELAGSGAAEASSAPDARIRLTLS